MTSRAKALSTRERFLDAWLDDDLATTARQPGMARALRERAHEREVRKILPSWPSDSVYDPSTNSTAMPLSRKNPSSRPVSGGANRHTMPGSEQMARLVPIPDAYSDEEPLEWPEARPKEWLGPAPEGWDPAPGERVRILGDPARELYGLTARITRLEPLTVRLELKSMDIFVTVSDKRLLCPLGKEDP